MNAGISLNPWDDPSAYEMIRSCNIIFLCFVVLFASCSKTEEVIVRDNTPPPDHTIETVIIENYVNRVYIDVLGREPQPAEFDSAVARLKRSGLDSVSRYQFLDEVFSDSGYRWNVFNKAREELLNDLDTSEISSQISIFNFFLADSTYMLLWPVLGYEIERLDTLRSTGNGYTSNSMNITRVHRNMVDNWFYDQINMGADNFVIETFQYFLGRYPTSDELTAGVAMLNGNNDILFLQAGSGKEDYLRIFFESMDYYEGIVIRLYNRYLFRGPSSVEMTDAALKWKISGDYESVQKDILATNEYIGL